MRDLRNGASRDSAALRVRVRAGSQDRRVVLDADALRGREMITQLDLDWERRHVHRDGPPASHFAAARAKGTAAVHKQTVLKVLDHMRPWPQSCEEVAHLLRAAEAFADLPTLDLYEVRRRMSDLHNSGQVEKAWIEFGGVRKLDYDTESCRKSHRWRIVEEVIEL